MPGISQEAKELNRAKILESASVMFREQGADQVGIDQLMRVAGLTRGGFYNHFDSKEALVAEACRKAFDEQRRHLDRFLKDEGSKPALHPLIQVAERYLATYHRDAPGIGCPAPTLGSEVARHGERVQRSYADGVQAYLTMFADLLTKDLPDRDSDAAARSGDASAGMDSGDVPASQRDGRAVAVEAFILMVGGMMLSRAVGEVDQELSVEFLTTAQGAIRDLL